MTRQTLYLAVCGIFFASYIIRNILGVRFVFEVIPLLWQYLDLEILKNDLVRGVYFLHAQPPLFNLLIGLVLKISGPYFAIVFEILFQWVALGTLVLMATLMETFGIRRWIQLLVIAFYAFFPAFIVYSNYVFYTIPVAFLILLSARLLLQLTERDTVMVAHLFCFSLAGLMLTRATYHVFWYAAVIASICLIRKTNRRKLLIASILPLVIVLLWSWKNHSLVGNFGLSSWLGMNMSRGWIVTNEKLYSRGYAFKPEEAEALARSGMVSPAWVIGPFRHPNLYRNAGYFPSDAQSHRALSAELKSSKMPNFNHIEYARISRDQRSSTIHVIKNDPIRYLKRIGTAYMAYMQPGPGVSWTFTRFYDFRKVLRYRNAVSLIFFGRPEHMPSGVIPFNLLMIAFPALIVYSIYNAIKSGNTMERVFLVYAVITILNLTFTCIAIELGENDRIRGEIDPLLFVLAGFFFNALAQRHKTRKSPR